MSEPEQRPSEEKGDETSAHDDAGEEAVADADALADAGALADVDADLASVGGGSARLPTPSLSARAHNTGEKVAFRREKPVTPAHELAHVVQQRGGKTK